MKMLPVVGYGYFLESPNLLHSCDANVSFCNSTCYTRFATMLNDFG